MSNFQIKVTEVSKKTGNRKEYTYSTEKDFRNMFETMPKNRPLKSNVITRVFKNSDISSTFILHADYDDKELDEYKKFMEDTFKKIKANEVDYAEQIRENKYSFTDIVVKAIK